MRDERVASRYAKSILELALEKGVLEDVHHDMSLFLSTYRNTPEFKSFLKSPIIKADKKESVIREVFSGQLQDMSLQFILLLVSKGRENILDLIALEFIKQYKIHKNIATAQVITAVELSKDLRKRFISIVEEKTGSTADLVEVVDPEIIGGFILKIGDQQIDSSISGKLEQLRSEFSSNPYIKEY